MENMKIERITREKAGSLTLRIPSLGSVLPLKGDDASFYMISEDGFLSVSFAVAVVEDGEITFISDEGRREALKRYLES